MNSFHISIQRRRFFFGDRPARVSPRSACSASARPPSRRTSRRWRPTPWRRSPRTRGFRRPSSSACRRWRPISSRDIPRRLATHRRTHQLRASAGAVLPGQRQLRHLGLCRAFRPGLALWPRRPRLWLGADLWRARRAGRQSLHRAYPWRDRSQRHHRSRGSSAAQPRLVA